MTSSIYQLFQTRRTGHSGKGMSYWKTAAECGHKTNLIAQQGEREPWVNDPTETNAAEVGIAFHLLMEAALTDQPVTWDATDEIIDASFLEGLRLYRAYIQLWGPPQTKWGAVAWSPEVQLPSSPEGAARILARYGQEVTGRADAILELDEAGVAKAAEFNVMLPGPGTYILDFKTGRAKNSMDEWEYMFGLQTKNYLSLYNLEHPEKPAQGIIFDKVYRHKNLTKDSFGHFFATADENDTKVVANLIKLAVYQVENDVRNPGACIGKYGPCPFLKNGKCGGF